MKKITFIALIVFGFLLSNIVSAASVPLNLVSSSNSTVITGTGSTVVGGGVFGTEAIWNLNLGTARQLMFDFTPTTSLPFGSSTPLYTLNITNVLTMSTITKAIPFTASLPFWLSIGSGDNTISVLASNLTGGTHFSMIVATPIPAATWLFGSVVMGFFGFKRRKSMATSVAA